ncbi:molybdopterin-guanine dinucleotide biosynthesis protein B [bacterium]|nr:molybdopterin-guanine dinucleotide biosynthesis protein B [bacterium]MBU1614934.1 molybdopterin-guanine dinucleotide biosynthesis protein B [bacterium]
MVPIVAIIGKKGNGKTHLIEHLIPVLKSRGYRVGTIKHDVHGLKPEDVDRKGKDTYRHQVAGAERVVLAGPNKLFLTRELEEELPVDRIGRGFLCGLDIVLAEGFKDSKLPKIEVLRSEVSDEPLSTKENGLVALVSDKEIDPGVPVFGLDDYEGLADFLEDYIKEGSGSGIELRVDGKEIALKSFAAEIIKEIIRGMISTLNGVPEKPESIEIKIKKGEK